MATKKAKSKTTPKVAKPKPETLPKRAPRKSGRRGMTLASAPSAEMRVAEESKVTVIEEDFLEQESSEPEEPETQENFPDDADQEQPELLLEVKAQPKPVVVNDRFEMLYIKCTCTPAPKTGDPTITMKVSTSLTEDHKAEGLLPEIVLAAWKWVQKNGRKNARFEIPPQTISIYSTPDIEEELLHLTTAKITGASVSVVQKKGDGANLKVIRLQFNIQVPTSQEVGQFAENQVGKRLWFRMQTSQEELFEESDEE